MATLITKNSSTASAAPLAADLTQGELAVNVTDKKLYSKDSGGAVVKLVGGLGNQEANAVAITGGAVNGTTVGATTASTGAFTTLAASGAVTLSGGTASGVTYLNGSKVLTSGSALTFDGANLGVGTSSPIRKLSVSNSGAEGLEIGPGSINGDTSGAVTSVYYNRSSSAYVNAIENANSFIYQTSGTEGMRLTSTGLGIGTSSPSQKLELSAASVFAKTTGTTGYSGLYATNTSGNLFCAIDTSTGSNFGGSGYARVIYASGAYPLDFYTNDVLRMKIDSSGNLGLGVTPSAWGTDNSVRALQFNAGSIYSFATTVMYFNQNAFRNSSGNRQYSTTAAATEYEQSGGAHKWFNAPSGTAGNTISFTQAMTLDASGRQLLGHTSSQGNNSRLQVSGSAEFFGSQGGNGPLTTLSFYNTNSSGFQIATMDVITGANFYEGIIRWQTKDAGGTVAERVRIDSSGNLLVGTTSVDGDGSKIQKSTSQNRVFTVQNTANVNGDQGLWIKLGSNCNTTASPAFVCDTGGTNRLLIWGNGNVVNTNNSYGAISDVKLKENIVDASPKLADLMQVKVRSYNMIGETTKQLGVVAQELETVFPTMVDESPDRDKQGNVLETKTKSVKYSVFVPMLIKALQELKAEFDAYKASHP